MANLKELTWNEAIELASPYTYVLAVINDKDGKANIIGLGWWTYVSWDPPMLAISIGKPRYSHECIEHSKEFVLCFPCEEQRDGAWLCGTKSGRDIDKFKAAEFVPIPSKIVKPPIIQDSTVAYECKVVGKLDAGDHTVYTANIVAMHGTPDKASHLFTVHYRKLMGIDFNGNIKIL